MGEQDGGECGMVVQGGYANYVRYKIDYLILDFRCNFNLVVKLDVVGGDWCVIRDKVIKALL